MILYCFTVEPLIIFRKLLTKIVNNSRIIYLTSCWAIYHEFDLYMNKSVSLVVLNY